MRPWVEKLAQAARERGYTNTSSEHIHIDNFCYTLNFSASSHKKLYLSEGYYKKVAINIYEDEYDLLKATGEFVEKKTQDEFIEMINNL
jgi:hypothetical protein